MRYVRLHVWLIFAAIIIGVVMLLKCSGGSRGTFQSASPVNDSLITSSYPDLYDAVFQRDARQLTSFLTHKSSDVRAQAWKALANTPVDSLSSYIELAKQQNSEEAWFAVSQQDLTGPQLRDLEETWSDNPEMRMGITRVLGQQGDEQSLDFLLDQFENNSLPDEYQLGLAVSRLLTRFEISGQEQISIIQQAFAAEQDSTTRAYLYGWYRGSQNELTSVAKDTLSTRWRVFGVGTSPEVDQYINRLLKEQTTHRMAIFYNGEQDLESEVQLSYELAQSINELELNDDIALAAKILMVHANPHVQVQALQSISGKLATGDDLYKYISREMVTDSTLTNMVWLQAMETAVQVDPAFADQYQDRLNQISDENTYLLPKVLAVYEKTATTDEYLSRVQEIISRDNSLSTMYALQSLDSYWNSLSEQEQTSSRVDQVREMTFNALSQKDRGVAFTAQSLLGNEDLFESSDFTRINSALSEFSLPGDIEVYQAFGSLYKDRFESQAQPVVDSLASLNYVPLNRSLADAGWDIEVPEESSSDFRTPDWERLWQLGRHPVLTLRTEKGDVSIRLNTLSAPATISAIDSLSRAGAYDGIPFHRVVPNFVIQGGDFERRDGFGGPDFVIPTEASAQGFTRGAIGIASAGTDTEGSQYFIMHQWKPHLNGSYTRFGEVIDGMDVVDRIVEGDKVLSTTWY